jgi:hypothetical protein
MLEIALFELLKRVVKMLRKMLVKSYTYSIGYSDNITVRGFLPQHSMEGW